MSDVMKRVLAFVVRLFQAVWMCSPMLLWFVPWGWGALLWVYACVYTVWIIGALLLVQVLKVQGRLRFEGWADVMVARYSVHKARDVDGSPVNDWWGRLWKGTCGQAAPFVHAMLHPRVTTPAHELRHNWQHFVFGPVFVPCWLGSAALAAAKGDWYKNWFERDAQRHAEQVVGR